jgi:anti-sigma B factor antagonist
MEKDMTIDEQYFDRYVVLTPRSGFWSSGGWELYDTVKEAMTRGIVHVIVDMHLVERINSLGIGVLVAALKTLRDKGGDLKMVAPSTQVVSVLQIVNLYTLMNIYPSLDEAAASVPAA